MNIILYIWVERPQISGHSGSDTRLVFRSEIRDRYRIPKEMDDKWGISLSVWQVTGIFNR